MRIPEQTINTALRCLASFGPDTMPREMPDDDGETLAAIMVYSELNTEGLVTRSEDVDHIIWEISPDGIRRMQSVDGLPERGEDD